MEFRKTEHEQETTRMGKRRRTSLEDAKDKSGQKSGLSIRAVKTHRGQLMAQDMENQGKTGDKTMVL